MAEAVRYSDLQDDLNASGYDGLINLILVSDGTYEGYSANSGVKVPYLYPCTTGLANLGALMGWAELNFSYAVILDKDGNRVDYMSIYPGANYSLVDTADYETIRTKLIDAAHASGLYPATANVRSPNGGELFPVGSSQVITWDTAGVSGNAKIELFKGGVLHSTIIASTLNDGSYTWAIPSDHDLGDDFKVKVTPLSDTGKADESDNNFTIANPVYLATMDGNPGWTLEGEWGYGAPASMTETCYVPPDPPSSAYSGSSVIGYDLNGTYNAMAGTEWATSPTIDCSDYADVTLTFRRYLGVYTGDKAWVQVKNGSGSWQTIYESTSWENSAAWQLVTYDISAVADGQSGVQIRCGIGPVSSGYTFCGMYIDDVVVDGTFTGSSSTSNGTPYAWLAAHGITNSQESADVSDPDGDGALTWQEYQAGTDPTDPGSVFCVLDVSSAGSSNLVTWYGTTNSGVVTYFILYRCTDIQNPVWQSMGTTPRNPSGINTWWDTSPPATGPVFYRPALP